MLRSIQSLFSRVSLKSTFTVLLIAASTVLITPPAAHAQDPAPAASDPSGFQPYESFHGGDIDTVGLSNGQLVIDHSILAYQQRGDLQVDFALQHNSKAQSKVFCDKEEGCITDDWRVSAVNFGFNQQTRVSLQQIYWFTPRGGLPVYYYIYSVKTPDGSSHLMGQINNGTWPVVYQALDGSGWRGLRYSNIQTLDAIISPSGVRQSSQVTWEDTNGNYMSLSSDATMLTDALGRHIPIPLPAGTAVSNTDSSGCTGPLPVTVAELWTPPGQSAPGQTNGTATYKLCFATVNYQTRAGAITPAGGNDTPGTYSGNFPALQSIVLPNGTTWTFEYSDRDPGDPSNINYGSLTKITLPTGGTISYTYTFGSNSYCGDYSSRWVHTRSLDANDGSGPHAWTYSYYNYSLPTNPTTTVTNPDGSYSTHSFTNLGNCSLYERQTQSFDASGALLKSTTTEYNYNTTDLSADPVGVRPIRITTSLPNGSSSKVSKIEKNYDSGFSYYDRIATVPNYQSVPYGKVISETVYDSGTNAPGPALRTTNTQYLALADGNYWNNNLLDLVSSTQVLDGSGNQVAYSYNEYDKTALQPSGVSPQLLDVNPPAGPYRGNLTTTHRLLTPTNVWISDSSSFYDSGEVYQKTDPMGHTATFKYDLAFAGAYLTSVTDALNHTTTNNFDFNTGVKLSTTDANSQTTTPAYDGMLRFTSVTAPADSSGQKPQTTYAYQDGSSVDPPNVVIQRTIDGRQTFSKTLFDGLGRATRKEAWNDEGNDPSQYYDQADTCFDAMGRKSFQSYAYRASGFNTTRACRNSQRPGDTFTYDGLGRPKQVVHSDGSTVTTDYSGAATQVTSESNGTTPVQRISQTDPLGRLLSVCELSSSTQQSIADGNGNAIANDGSPVNCGQDINGIGFLTTYSYDAMGNLLTVHQGNLLMRSFTYDSLGHVLTAYNPEAGTTTYTYDNAGNVLTRTRPASNAPPGSGATVITTYQYDALNRLLSVTYSDGLTANVSIAYDENSVYGLPAGTLTNTIGRKSSEKVTDPQTGAILSASIYSYDPSGHPIYNAQCTVQSCPSLPSGFYPFNYSYNLAGDMLSSTNGVGVTFQSSYNSGEHLIKMTSSLSDTNHPGTLFANAHYSTFGSLTSASLGNGAVESVSYYPNGRLQSINTIGPNPASNTAGTGSVTFNGTEQTTQVPSTPGTGSVTISGEEERFPYPDNCVPRTCQWAYDSGTVTITVNGSNYSVNYGKGSSASNIAAALSNSLNASGLVSASTSDVAWNQSVIYLTAQQLGPSSNYSLSASSATNDPYDFGLGSFSTGTSGSSLTGGSNATVYDAGTVTVTVGVGTTTQISKTSNYNAGSTPASIASDVASQFHNDSTSLVDATALGPTLKLTSRASGASSNYTLSASSATTNTSYFSQPSFTGAPSGATLTGGANGQATLYNLALTYAPNGSIVTAHDTANGNWSYAYDEFNRLASSNLNNGAQTFNYNYDRYGNRCQQNAPQGGPTPQYVFNQSNQIVGSGVTYDAAGNVVNDGLGHVFTYDAENRIVSVNGGSARYIYDGQGARVRKTTSAGTVDYLYDLGGHVITELTNGTWTRGEVFAGGGHLATYFGGNALGSTTYFVHSDWQGTERVRSLVTGPMCETISNLPFGDAQTLKFFNGCTTDVSPLHFTGKQSDPESGLDDFPARYYSPVAGRWMSPDWAANAVAVPYANFGNPQTLNLYAYVGDDPIDGTDADGHFKKKFCSGTGCQITKGVIIGTGKFALSMCSLCMSVRQIVQGVKDLKHPEAAHARAVAQGKALVTFANATNGDPKAIATVAVTAAQTWNGMSTTDKASAVTQSLWTVGSLFLGGAVGAGETAAEGTVEATSALEESSQLALPAATGYNPWVGEITSEVTQTDTVMYRVWGDEAGQVGGWLTPNEPTSRLSAIQDLALPPQNSAQYVSRVLVPAGTRIQTGTAASAFGQPGGGAQVLLLDRIPTSNFGPGVPLGPH